MSNFCKIYLDHCHSWFINLELELFLALSPILSGRASLHVSGIRARPSVSGRVSQQS